MKSMTVQESLTRAQTAFRIGDYAQAEQLLLSLTQAKPRLAEVYNFLGSIYGRMADYGRAVRQFKKAIELRANYAEAYSNLGVALKNMQRFEGAIAAFRKALRFAPQRADIHYNLGNICKNTGKDAEAIEEFVKAQELDPSFVPTYNNLGTIYEQLGRLEEAVAVYRKGLEVDFNQPSLHYNLGIVMKRTGKLKEAQAEFEQALKVKPGWVEALNNLGVVLQLQGNSREALKVYQRMLRQDPGNVQARNNMGVVHAELGRSDEAVRFYREALKLNPKYSQAVANLSSLLEERGQYGEALEEFEKLLKLDPQNRDARFRLANCYLYLDRFEEASALLQRVVQEDPKHAPSLRALARIAHKTGQSKEAEAYYRRLLEAEPDSAELHLDLAEAARESGQLQKAEEELRELLAKQPEHLPARLLLGELYFQQNKLKHAAEIFKAILERDPGYVAAHEYLAKTYRRMGEPEKALATLEKVMTLEGTRAEASDIDKLRDTLELYEDTIADYAPRFQEDWQANIRRLAVAERRPGSFEGERERQDLDSMMVGEIHRVEEDVVPIIDIGGKEPVLAIEEEEERLDLFEVEEPVLAPVAEPSVEIKDETPPSLVNLLAGQALYEQNPEWRDFQLPASLQEQPAPAQPAEGPRPAEAVAPMSSPARAQPFAMPSPARPQPFTVPPPSPGLTSQERELLAQSMRESARAQAQMARGLSEDLRDIYRSLDLRPQIIPIPMPPIVAAPVPMPQSAAAPYAAQPVFAPSFAPGLEPQGIPRFAREEQAFEEYGEPEALERWEQVPAFPESEQEGEPSWQPGGEEAGAPPQRGTAAAGLRTRPAAPQPVPSAAVPPAAAEALPGRRGTPASVPAEDTTAEAKEEAGDLRQQLKDYLKGVRGKMDEAEQKEEGKAPEELRPEMPRPADERRPTGLVSYLEELATYLPERDKSGFLRSDARLKLEYLKSKLEGRRGIKRRIESSFSPRAPQSPVTLQKIAAAFTFMKDLATFHPDKMLGTIMQSKLNGILRKIKG